MRQLLFSIALLVCPLHSALAQFAQSATVRAFVNTPDPQEGVLLAHFTAQVEIRPAGGSPVTLLLECDGSCVFDNLPKGSTLVFSAYKADEPDDSVSTYDMVLMSKHITGDQTLQSPYQFIAADADCNGLVENKDIVIVRSLILRKDTTLCVLWTLLDAAALLPANPLQAPLPREITVRDYDGGPLDITFLAIKIGNVSGYATPPRIKTPPSGVFVSAPQPNPTPGAVWFAVQLPEAATLYMEVFDAAGRSVYADRLPARAGAQQVELPAGALPVAGVYFWRMVADGARAGGRVVRM